MALTNSAETALLALIFNNTAWANIGNSGGLQPSGAAGSLYVALFEGDPTDAGTVTSECDYTSYARVAVARSGAGWTVSGDEAVNAALVSFPKATGGDNTATHWGVCHSSAGGNVVLHGELNEPLAISNNITPVFEAGQLKIKAH